MYDSRIGRWLSLDPLAKKYPDMSPYLGMGNNPNYFGDPDGGYLINRILPSHNPKRWIQRLYNKIFGFGHYNDLYEIKHNLRSNESVVQEVHTSDNIIVVIQSRLWMGVGKPNEPESEPDYWSSQHSYRLEVIGKGGGYEGPYASSAEISLDPTPIGAVSKAVLGKTVNPLTKILNGAIYHIFSNKHNTYWTNVFKPFFEKAGYGLDDAINKVTVIGHSGRHTESYHRYVYRQIFEATENLDGEDYKNAFESVLNKLAKEAQTEGTEINKLLIQKE